MKNKMFLIVGFGLLSSCANVVLEKAGASQIEYQQDMNQCEYEASSHTQNTDYSMGTMFGQELDRAMRKRELILKCMKTKGWEAKK